MNSVLGSIASVAPAIAMLGAFSCAIGGGYLLATKRDAKKGALMLVMAAVLVGNVLVWTM
jgi:hypothetical protein